MLLGFWACLVLYTPALRGCSALLLKQRALLWFRALDSSWIALGSVGWEAGRLARGAFPAAPLLRRASGGKSGNGVRAQ
jgi:hypothetical protein